MPRVPMVAKSGFTYMTRRLQAGDPFEARNPLEAKILDKVRGVAEYPTAKLVTLEKAAAPEAPPAEAEPAPFVPTIKEVLEAKVAAPKAKTAPKAAKKTRRAKAKR